MGRGEPPAASRLGDWACSGASGWVLGRGIGRGSEVWTAPQHPHGMGGSNCCNHRCWCDFSLSAFCFPVTHVSVNVRDRPARPRSLLMVRFARRSRASVSWPSVQRVGVMAWFWLWHFPLGHAVVGSLSRPDSHRIDGVTVPRQAFRSAEVSTPAHSHTTEKSHP
jgi:hypothetical protein